MQRKVRFNTKQEAKQFVATLVLGSLGTNANIYKGHREFVVQYEVPMSTDASLTASFYNAWDEGE